MVQPMSHPLLMSHPGPPPMTNRVLSLSGDEDGIVAHLSKLLGEKDALVLRIKAMNDQATERERERSGEGLEAQDQAQVSHPS